MSQGDQRFISIDRTDGIGQATMTSADGPIAMSPQDADDLAAAIDELVQDRSVRCVVLTGEGSTFNTGADLSMMDGHASDGQRIRRIANRLHRAIRTMVAAPKPVITGVNGTAAGGGFGLALAGDIVVMADSASFTFAYPRIGLSGDGGATYFLPAILGHRRAREFVFEDRPIDAAEAVDLGLATDAVPDDAFASAVITRATRLAEGPTRAYGRVKRLLLESNTRPFEDQLRAEVETIATLTETADYAAGIEAFQSGDDPEFVGR